MFLEKTKLKNVSINDADLVHDLRINLIVAQKYYVLDAPLGDCSDPTRMDQVSVLKCHPWIGMLTHTVLEDL